MKPYTCLLSILGAILIYTQATAQTWSSVGTGADNSVYSMQSFDGGLAIGGNFRNFDGGPFTCMTYLEPMGDGVYFFSDELTHNYDISAWMDDIPGVHVTAMAEMDDRLHMGGQLYYYLYFDPLHIGYHEYDEDAYTYNFNIYNGPMTQFDFVSALQVYDNKLFIGGYFPSWGSAHNVGYIESESYPSPYPKSPGKGLDGVVRCMAVYKNELYAGGEFETADSISVNGIARWNGSVWQPVGSGVDGEVFSMTVYNNELIVGGSFTNAGGISVNNIAKWNGSNWSAISTGLSGSSAFVFALEVYGKNLYAGGKFSMSGSATINNLAKWNGVAWSALGSGTNEAVRTMEVFEGSLFIGGDFTEANGENHNHIVSYNDGSAGVKEIINSQSIEVYPNPTADEIHFDMNGNREMKITEVVVYDAIGNKTQTYSGIAINRLELQGLDPGVYFMQVYNKDDLVATKRFIRQ